MLGETLALSATENTAIYLPHAVENDLEAREYVVYGSTIVNPCPLSDE